MPDDWFYWGQCGENFANKSEDKRTDHYCEIFDRLQPGQISWLNIQQGAVIESQNRQYRQSGRLQGVVVLNSAHIVMKSEDGQTVFSVGTDSLSSLLSGFLVIQGDNVAITCTAIASLGSQFSGTGCLSHCDLWGNQCNRNFWFLHRHLSQGPMKPPWICLKMVNHLTPQI